MLQLDESISNIFIIKKINEINVLTKDIKITIYSSKLSKENYFIFFKTYPKEKSLFVYFLEHLK